MRHQFVHSTAHNGSFLSLHIGFCAVNQRTLPRTYICNCSGGEETVQFKTNDTFPVGTLQTEIPQQNGCHWLSQDTKRALTVCHPETVCRNFASNSIYIYSRKINQLEIKWTDGLLPCERMSFRIDWTNVQE